MKPNRSTTKTAGADVQPAELRKAQTAKEKTGADALVADDLRIKVSELSEPERGALAQRLRDSIQGLAERLGIHSLQALARFADMERHNEGCTTPAESFVEVLVSAHYEDPGLTPDMALREIEEFRSDYESAIAAARRMTYIGYADVCAGVQDAARLLESIDKRNAA